MDELGYLCLLRSDKMGKAMAKLANFHVVGWAIISEDARWDIHSYTMKAAPEEFWPSGHEAPSLNLQTGHVACCLSHWSMHIQWNCKNHKTHNKYSVQSISMRLQRNHHNKHSEGHTTMSVVITLWEFVTKFQTITNRKLRWLLTDFISSQWWVQISI
jgi:hypothetical protein